MTFWQKLKSIFVYVPDPEFTDRMCRVKLEIEDAVKQAESIASELSASGYCELGDNMLKLSQKLKKNALNLNNMI